MQSLEKDSNAASKDLVKETAAYSHKKETYDSEVKEREGVAANAREAKATHGEKQAAFEQRAKQFAVQEKKHNEMKQDADVSRTATGL
jgi:hypothetical protein